MYRTPQNRRVSDLTFFITASLRNRRLVFTDEIAAKAVLDSLQFFRTHGEIELYGYVVMPDHIHIIVKVLSPRTLPEVMRRFKTYTARAIGQGSIWERGYHSEVLAGPEISKQKLNYIHENPVKKGYVAKAEDFRWSSAAEYLRGENFTLLDYVFGPPSIKVVEARR